MGSWVTESVNRAVQAYQTERDAAELGHRNLIDQRPLVHHPGMRFDRHGPPALQPPRLRFYGDSNMQHDTFNLQMARLSIEPHESEASSRFSRRVDTPRINPKFLASWLSRRRSRNHQK